MWPTLVLFMVCTALLLAALAWPLARGAVGPNRWYGVRLPQTLADPDLWYPVNRFFGRRMVFISLQVAAASLVLALVPGIDMVLYVLLLTGMLTLGALIAAVQAMLLARRLAREKQAEQNATGK